jgi:hypothetical protein
MWKTVEKSRDNKFVFYSSFCSSQQTQDEEEEEEKEGKKKQTS